MRRASAGGRLRVDQEAHSGAPQHWMIVLPSGKLEDRSDVFVLQVRVVGEDLRGKRGCRANHRRTRGVL